VTERSRLFWLVVRRKSGAKDSRKVASSGSGAGLALGTADVVRKSKTASTSIRRNTADASSKRKIYHRTND
jgi:hypothetical protein